MARTEKIVPPPEIEEYHFSRLASIRAIVDMAEHNSTDTVMNPYELMSNESTWILLLAYSSAEESLSGNTRKILRDAGCINEPDPTPTPVSVVDPDIGLSDTEQADLWVWLSTDEYDVLIVEIDAEFDADEYEIDLFIDSAEYCNSSRIYSDEGRYGMSCEHEEKKHTTVQRVSAQTDQGDLRCARNVQSTEQQTIFACAWR